MLTSHANFSRVTSPTNFACQIFARCTSPVNLSSQLFASYFKCQICLPTFRELLHLPTSSPTDCLLLQLPTSPANVWSVTSRANFACQLFGRELLQFSCQLFESYFTCQLPMPTAHFLRQLLGSYFTCHCLMSRGFACHLPKAVVPKKGLKSMNSESFNHNHLLPLVLQNVENLKPCIPQPSPSTREPCFLETRNDCVTPK